MAENSKIEWTDHTFNPWIGCTKVSPGCANCYAENLMDTRMGKAKWGKGQPRVRTSAANWKLPLKWDRKATSWSCEKCRTVVADPEQLGSPFTCPNCQYVLSPHRPRVFCASLADWLDDEVPIEWLADLLDLIRRTPNLDWLLLTKRPKNFESRIEAAFEYTHGENWQSWESLWLQGQPPANIWIGTTVEDQTRADERIPALLRIPAKVRFLSCEPLLGPVDLLAAELLDGTDYIEINEAIHWVICGGESGRSARPMHTDWARSLRDQCKAAGVPFLFKQWGEWADCGDAIDRAIEGVRRADNERIVNWAGGHGFHGERPMVMARVGKTTAGRLLDGIEHNEFPKQPRAEQGSEVAK